MQENKENRNLGDEWSDWKGDDTGNTVNVSKALYLIYAALVFIISDFVVILATYLITPRLALWHESLPVGAWIGAITYVVLSTVWCIQLGLTAVFEKKCFLFDQTAKIAFAATFGAAFRLANIMKISRDKLGNSFVKVSNSITKAMKKERKVERLLILLPRCISKTQIDKIKLFKNEYELEVAVVAGGEQARKKVREIKPTAVIGVACERDLVSGIKDVANKVSVIGIPNQRPEGPCKNTIVDLDEVKRAVEFYLGVPNKSVS